MFIRDLVSTRQKSSGILLAGLAILLAQLSCEPHVIARNRADEIKIPPLVLWAWERPENLEFLDPQKVAVAFLAQTLILRNDEVQSLPRRQPLIVSPATKLIAVTRIEPAKTTGNRAFLSGSQKGQLITLISKTLELKNVVAIQVDFDATVSERHFYRELLEGLRQKLPDHVPLSMTALASFCLGDRWLKDLPVDEAVPMIFRMGTDDQNIKGYLANGNDFVEPLCRKSYGIATDEPLSAKIDQERRVYVFNSRPWTERDLAAVSKRTWK